MMQPKEIGRRLENFDFSPSLPAGKRAFHIPRVPRHRQVVAIADRDILDGWELRPSRL